MDAIRIERIMEELLGDHRKSIGNNGPTRIRPKYRKKIYITLAEMYGDKCFYCTRSFMGDRRRLRTIDHLKPLSRGGTNELSNLVLACSKCNGTKGDMTWWEYFHTETYHTRRANGTKDTPERPPRSTVEFIRSLRFWDSPSP